MGNEPIYTLYSPLSASFCTTKYQLEPILRHILTSWRQFLTIKITLRLIAGVRGSKWVIVGTNGVSPYVSECAFIGCIYVCFMYVLYCYVIISMYSVLCTFSTVPKSLFSCYKIYIEHSENVCVLCLFSPHYTTNINYIFYTRGK